LAIHRDEASPELTRKRRKRQQMRSLLTCVWGLLLTAWVFGQGKPQSHEGQNAAAANAGAGSSGSAAEQGGMAPPERAEFPPETTVLTVKGVCEPAAKGAEGTPCKTEVKRTEIDAVINTLGPKATSAERRKLAINYARLVAAAAEAERQHLEKDPEVMLQVAVFERLVRLQVMANKMYLQMQARANNVPDAEVAKYYSEHGADFEQGEVRMLSLPKSIVSQGAEAQELGVLKAKAEELRTRAAAGEDFDQLQEETYKELGIKTGLPSTKLNTVSRMNLPTEEKGVLDLEAGQVSPVMELPGAFVVMKLVSKQRMPLESANAQIVSTLQQERLKEEMRNALENGKAEFNLKYFELAAAPDLYPPPEVTGLPAGQNGPVSYAQRTPPTRKAMMPRKREVTLYPTTRP
jgi:hypothetical protein